MGELQKEIDINSGVLDFERGIVLCVLYYFFVYYYFSDIGFFFFYLW